MFYLRPVFAGNKIVYIYIYICQKKKTSRQLRINFRQFKIWSWSSCAAQSPQLWPFISDPKFTKVLTPGGLLPKFLVQPLHVIGKNDVKEFFPCLICTIFRKVSFNNFKCFPQFWQTLLFCRICRSSSLRWKQKKICRSTFKNFHFNQSSTIS